MSFIPSLDHIIILVPQTTLDSLPPLLTSALTIYPGGTHADNKTTNSLVLLRSGVYLELIAFIDDDPSKKEGHWWGKKQSGTVIDFALTSESTSDIQRIREALAGKTGRLGEIGYAESKKGGRKRPDGEQVKWEVTFPFPEIERGIIPFWCHDVTERELRVPVKTAEEATEHPSGAVGVAKLVLVVATDKFSELGEIYTKILGSEGGKSELGDEVSFTIKQPIPNSATSSIILRKAQTQEEKTIVSANGGTAGIWEIVLAIPHGHLPPSITEKIGDGTIRIRFESAPA